MVIAIAVVIPTIVVLIAIAVVVVVLVRRRRMLALVRLTPDDKSPLNKGGKDSMGKKGMDDDDLS